LFSSNAVTEFSFAFDVISANVSVWFWTSGVFTTVFETTFSLFVFKFICVIIVLSGIACLVIFSKSTVWYNSTGWDDITDVSNNSLVLYSGVEVVSSVSISKVISLLVFDIGSKDRTDAVSSIGNM